MHFLRLAHYAPYCPRLREMRSSHGRRCVVTPPLFPSYLFVHIGDRGWWDVRWSIGVAAVVMSGEQPAKLGDAVIAELKGREQGGLVTLPEPPRLRPGDQVRIVRGALAGLPGLVDGLRPHERVAVLLAVLGRVTLSAADVEAAG
jgi:transcription antitermination factor NusG